MKHLHPTGGKKKFLSLALMSPYTHILCAISCALYYNYCVSLLGSSEAGTVIFGTILWPLTQYLVDIN